MKETYRNTADKDEKTDMSRSIVDQVLGYGGRFVKKDSGSGRYYVLTKTEARIKTSQALRENRDSKASASTDDCESDSDTSCRAKKPGMDADSLDCCNALVSLSRADSPPLESTPRAA